LRTSTNIRTIFFDLGNVIVFFDHHRACRRLAAISGKTVAEIYHFVFESGLEDRLDRGEISADRFWNELRRFLGVTISKEDLRELWEDIFTPNTDIFPLITTLKREHTLFLLSNTNEIHYRYCRAKYPILNLFDDAVLSFRVGSRKPEDRIFNRALERAGIPPEKAVYIDDIQRYILKARELGIHGVHYSSVPRLKEDLKELGIAI
jgi:putative hydrolase of the HAD superfamily